MISKQPLPYKAPQISKIEATIFRELIFSKRALAIFPNDPAKTIQFFDAASSPSIEEKFSFSLKVGEEKVDLSIELKPETSLAQRLNDVGGIDSLPEDFRVALMTFASREISSALEKLFQLPVIVWDNEKIEEAEKKDLFFKILNSDGSCEARARISLSLPLLDRVLAVAKEIPMIKENSLPGELLQAEVLIGSATLSYEDCKILTPGDLIIIEEPCALTRGEGRCLIKKSGLFPMVLKPEFLKSLVLPIEKMPVLLKAPPHENEDASQEVEVAKESEKSLVSTADSLTSSTFNQPAATPHVLKEHLGSREATASISLELNFSGGSLSLTIDEALALIKTKSLEKPLQVSRPLKILIQEQTVGSGELVAINGRYAVMVTQTFSKFY